MIVFISYAKEDRAAAKRLYDFLESVPGVIPWMDTKNLMPGDDWEAVIANAMEKSRLIILLLSNSSVDKEGFVQKEVRDALELHKRKPHSCRFIIPARLEYCTPKFPDLKKLHWADLFEDWDSETQKIRKVIEQKQALQREIDEHIDKVQRTKNRNDALQILKSLPTALKENLALYAEWLWRHEYNLLNYNKARRSIPNWTKQAKADWIELLQRLCVLEQGNPEKALFTDVGIELLDQI